MASTAPVERPSGTVTLLFTDIEGSTRLLQQLGSADYNELTSVSAALMDAATLEGLADRTERAARLRGAGLRAVDDAGGQAPPELVRRIELMPTLEEKLVRGTLAGLIAAGRQLAPAAAVAFALE